MSRTPNLTKTFALLTLAAGALALGARWSQADAAGSGRILAGEPQRPIMPPFRQPRLDVAFVLDTTGSMADEIAVVKDKIISMARELAAGQPRPDVRFGLVCYRDRGDDYVTQVFPFTRDIESLSKRVQVVNANGGGDAPESVNEAIHIALTDLDWDDHQEVSRQIFFIGDAGPHMDYAQDFDYRKEAVRAGELGIVIDTISCSGMDGLGADVFQHLARTTDGRFEYLTYARDMRQSDGSVKTYLEAGDATYEPASDVSEDEWRKDGAAKLRESDRATPITRSEVTGAQVGELKNNLDDVMVQRLKNRAVEEQGVVYDE